MTMRIHTDKKWKKCADCGRRIPNRDNWLYCQECSPLHRQDPHVMPPVLILWPGRPTSKKQTSPSH